MIQDFTADRAIGIRVCQKFEEDKKDHTPSGKLSASILGYPLQWQILKVIGVESDIDEYVKRKFQRGKDVEKWVTDNLPGFIEGQKQVNYKNTVGYIDALVDSKNYDFKCGVIPHEIKSVANAKYRRIVGQANKPGQGADKSHRLQIALYALALGTEYGAIDYVASDDYRITTYIIRALDYKDEIDKVIDDFYGTISLGLIPKFVPKESWQAQPNYCNYPDFMNLSENQCLEKVRIEYPDCYNKLINYGEPNEISS